MLIVVVFVLTLAIGAPVMAVLGVSTIIPLLQSDALSEVFFAQSLFTGLNQFVLISVLGFVFAGGLMEKCGITDGILEFARECVGFLPGGYAIMCVIASAFFAALTGSGPACTAAIGALTIPLMLGAGYDKPFAAGVAGVGGSLGIMIPPSNPMVIYATLATVSVGDMFIAGILPGILTAIFLSIVCVIISLRRGYHGRADDFSWKRLAKATWNAKWSILAPVLILGSIYGGICTPTEASMVAVVYALIIGLVNRKLSFKDIVFCLKRTIVMGGTSLAIVGICTAFGRVLTLNQVPQTVAAMMLGITSDKYLLLGLIMLVMIFVGMWMEPISSLIIVVPIFLTIVDQIAFPRIAFGILLVLTTQIAFITPPVAGNLYVVATLTKSPLQEVSKGVIPFILTLVLMCILIIFFPGIATWLPATMA